MTDQDDRTGQLFIRDVLINQVVDLRKLRCGHSYRLRCGDR